MQSPCAPVESEHKLLPFGFLHPLCTGGNDPTSCRARESQALGFQKRLNDWSKWRPVCSALEAWWLEVSSCTGQPVLGSSASTREPGCALCNKEPFLTKESIHWDKHPPPYEAGVVFSWEIQWNSIKRTNSNRPLKRLNKGIVSKQQGICYFYQDKVTMEDWASGLLGASCSFLSNSFNLTRVSVSPCTQRVYVPILVACCET